MIGHPACRAASTADTVGATAAWMLLIGTSALSNMPPGDPKAFCMSMTMSADRVGSISAGSGRAWMCMVGMSLFPLRWLVVGLSVAAALAPAGARSGALRVRFDDAGQQVEQAFSLGRFEHLEDVLLELDGSWVQLCEQLVAPRREADEPRSSIGLTRSARDESLSLEPCDEEACCVAVDAEPAGEAGLIEARFAVRRIHVRHHRELERCE